jgi:hypothetical protein
MSTAQGQCASISNLASSNLAEARIYQLANLMPRNCARSAIHYIPEHLIQAEMDYSMDEGSFLEYASSGHLQKEENYWKGCYEFVM